MIYNPTTLVGTTDQILVNGSVGVTKAGLLTLTLPQSIAPTSTPSFASISLTNLTPNSFLYSGTSGALTTTAAPTNGQLLIGSTGAAPVTSTLTPGPGILISNSAGAITVSATANALRQAGAVDIGPLTGTAQIGTTIAPTIADGFQIATITVTPLSVASTFVLNSIIWADNSNTNRSIQVAVFRNNTLVGSASSVITTSGRPQTLGILINDAPATISPITYSLRVGASGTGTTYINQSGTYNLGGSGKSSFTVNELII